MIIEHEQRIAAPVEVVWDLTIAVEQWPALMPTVTSVERLDEDPLRPGSRARLKQPGQRPTVWTVTNVDAPHRFTWEATTMGVRIVARHELDADGDACRNRLVLELPGRRGRLMGALLGPLFRRTLRTENGCFAERAEALVAAR